MARRTSIVANLAEQARQGTDLMEVVDLRKIKIDKDYQRDLNISRVYEISAAWDMGAAGTVIVSRRKGGELYLIDGQHRVAAAQQAGETEILSLVYSGLTPAQEADL